MKTNIRYSYYLSTKELFISTPFDTKEEAVQDRENAWICHGIEMGRIVEVDNEGFVITKN